MDGGGTLSLDAQRIGHHRDELLANGYSIMPDALDPAFCDEIVAEFGRMRGVWRRALVQSFHGRRTTRYFDLLNAAPIFQAIPIAPRVLGVVRAALGDDCLLGTYGSVSIGPGEPAQLIHADDSLYRIPRQHPVFYVNVILALSEFTEVNGATRLAPGSHAWNHYPEPGKSYESIAAEMPKGGALFTLGSIYHGGGANRTASEVRHGMTVAYVANWVRPQENFQAAVTQERAATFDPELQALMGWRLGPTAVGHTYAAQEHWTGPMAAKVALKRDFEL
jgi:ectoine hydroxylase-related dioxygenase (phytanoyl-CoA dioxygenase family)